MRRQSAFLCLLLLGPVTLISISCSPVRKKTNGDSTPAKFKPPGVIAQLQFRLGNQLFQIACNFALAKSLQLPLFVSSSLLENDKIFSLQNLTFINASTISAHKSQLFKFSDQDFLFTPWKIKQVAKSRSKFLYNYELCQSEIFFAEYKSEIVKLLTPRPDPKSLNPAVASWVAAIADNASISVAIHLRRGDYLQANWVTPIPFYRKGMKIILDKLGAGKRVKFFVFSNGIEYVKENLINPNATETTTQYGIPDPPKVREQLKNLISKIDPKNIFYVSGAGLSASEEFYLISKCKHAIISNSSFSWWAAYLIDNLKKLVIAPVWGPSFFEIFAGEEKRAFNRLIYGKYYYPKEWMVLDKKDYM